MSGRTLFAGLWCAVALAGCAMAPNPAEAPTFDLRNAAELDFVKGHAKAGLGHSGAESYSVCANPTCRPRIAFASLNLLSADTAVKRVPAGLTILEGYAITHNGRTMKSCRMRVQFKAEGGHAYVVKINNDFFADSCLLTVAEKDSGTPVHLTRMS